MPSVSTLATEKYKLGISFHSKIQVNYELKLSNEDANVIRRKFMLTKEKLSFLIAAFQAYHELYHVFYDKNTNQIFQIQKHINPLGLAWWCWLGTLECALTQGIRFDYPRCQFKLANLAQDLNVIMLFSTDAMLRLTFSQCIHFSPY